MTVSDLVSREIKLGEGQLVLLGGRPAMGKTGFAIKVAQIYAQKGYKVGYFSAEMSTQLWEFREAKFGPVDLEGVDVIDEETLSMKSIEGWFAVKKFDLVIIDYLQLIAGDSLHNNKRVKKLKELAKQYACPIIVVMQFARAIEYRDDPKPRPGDVICSYVDERLFEQYFLLYREGYYDYDADDTKALVILKDREEPLTWDWEKLTFD